MPIGIAVSKKRDDGEIIFLNTHLSIGNSIGPALVTKETLQHYIYSRHAGALNDMVSVIEGPPQFHWIES